MRHESQWHEIWKRVGSSYFCRKIIPHRGNWLWRSHVGSITQNDGHRSDSQLDRNNFLFFSNKLEFLDSSSVSLHIPPPQSLSPVSWIHSIQMWNLESSNTHFGHSGQWSTVYYASRSTGNQFPTRTLIFLRGLVLYPPLCDWLHISNLSLVYDWVLQVGARRTNN